MAIKCTLSFSLKWEEDFSWLKKSKDVDCAHCKYAINHLEVTVEVFPMLNHIRDQKVIKTENISSGSSNQRTFTVGSKTVNLSSGTFVLTQEESVIKAEIL